MSGPFRLRFFVIFAVLAIALVAFLDWKMFGSTGLHDNQATLAIQALSEPVVAAVEPAAGAQEPEIAETFEPADDPLIVMPESGEAFFDADPTEAQTEITRTQEEDESETAGDQIVITPGPMTPPAGNVAVNPKISIIIDDVGMNIEGSEETLDLPAPVTVAILPYAEKAGYFAQEAKEKGHEIIIHTPMEAMSADVDLGGLSLLTTQSDEEFQAELEKIFASFEGYVGINNHMGSKLTQDSGAMTRLMAALKKRGLFFVDSKTIHTSVAAQTADSSGVPYASRDVFLDHEETPEFVHSALQKLERVASEQGSAIAIGHPKGVTLEGLRAWMPQAPARGFEFVPVRARIRKPSQPVQDLGAAQPVPTQVLPRG